MQELYVFTLIFYYLHVLLICIHVSFDILFFYYKFQVRFDTVTTVDTVTQPDAGRQMAMTARRAVGRLAKAAFTRSLEWENQPAGRRLVARPAGTSRTIVAARGTFHRRAPSFLLFAAISDTYLDPARRTHIRAKGIGAKESFAVRKDPPRWCCARAIPGIRGSTRSRANPDRIDSRSESARSESAERVRKIKEEGEKRADAIERNIRGWKVTGNTCEPGRHGVAPWSARRNRGRILPSSSRDGVRRRRGAPVMRETRG